MPCVRLAMGRMCPKTEVARGPVEITEGQGAGITPVSGCPHDDLPFCRSRFLPHQTPATTRLPQNNE